MYPCDNEIQMSDDINAIFRDNSDIVHSLNKPHIKITNTGLQSNSNDTLAQVEVPVVTFPVVRNNLIMEHTNVEYYKLIEPSTFPYAKEVLKP